MYTAKQQQIVDKNAELERDISELQRYIDAPAPPPSPEGSPPRALAFSELDEAEQGRQRAQVAAMRVYADILAERIAAF